jgi:hypothetical protein
LAAHAAAHEVVFPGLGARIVERFDYWNARAFGNALPLMPIQIVPVAPYGHWIGRASAGGDSEGGKVKLQNRNREGFTSALDDVLLHELLHQYLHVRNEAAKHAASPWRREVERLSRELYGIEVECAPAHPVKGKRLTNPADYIPKRAGALPLVLSQYARWPHCLSTTHNTA